MTAHPKVPRFAFLAALAACSLLASCGKLAESTADATGTDASQDASQAALDPILADPEVGDLHAVELSHFSGASFHDEDNETVHGEMYGLMKVEEVTPDQITLITEMGGWPKRRGAINDLRGDLSDITWDESEKIQVRRSELAGLVAREKILESRRLGPEYRVIR